MAAQGRVPDSVELNELCLQRNTSTKPAPPDPFPTTVMLALSRRTAVAVIRDGRNLSSVPTCISSALTANSPSNVLSSLAGTVAHHTAYVFLHTHLPPAGYPGRSKSPLLRALALHARRWGGIVNFAWSPAQAVHPAYTGLGERADEAAGSAGAGAGIGEEAYVASVFASSRRGRLEIPEITLRNLDTVDATIHAHCQLADSSTDPAGVALDETVFLYVCTHGSRDCRCGDIGGGVARALRVEIAKRNLADRVSVVEVAHVGGHKYAANVLVYPYGDWLGMVQEVDVPRIVDELTGWHGTHHEAKTMTDLPPLCAPFWRGRMGLDKQQQLAALLSKPAPPAAPPDVD